MVRGGIIIMGIYDDEGEGEWSVFWRLGILTSILELIRIPFKVKHLSYIN
jgi:hypothetical protein